MTIDDFFKKANRFNNCGGKVAVVVPKKIQVIYGYGNENGDLAGDAGLYNSFNGFVIKWKHKGKSSDELVRELREKGHSIHELYMLKEKNESIIVPVTNGFIIYASTFDLKKRLEDEGYNIKKVSNRWKSARYNSNHN